MWFESTLFPDEIPGRKLSVGFDIPPGAWIGSDKHVLNAHTYCCGLTMHECDGGEPQVAHSQRCLEYHQQGIGKRSEDAERLGVPLVITEFGACFTDEACTQEIQNVATAADDNLVGWAYWQFKTYADLTTSAGVHSEGFYNQDGTLQEYKVKALARSYMPLTQGNL